MNITPAELGKQYDRAHRDWPVIAQMEARYYLPRMLLFAVGSRETNLENIVGDDHNGFGIFQRDKRSHPIPPGFMSDILLQAQLAAEQLQQAMNGRKGWALEPFGWGESLNRYNSGQPELSGTTGGDYGYDVLDRMAVLLTIR